MKAVVFHEHGGLDVLKYEDVPDPKPGPTDVVIKVQGVGVNFNDVWARRGLPGMKFDLPHISGSDLSGEVAEVGSAVTSAKVGDRVIIHPGVSCRICPACTSGHEYFCRQFKIYGFQTGPLDGGDAEYCRAPEVNVVPMPSNLSWEEGAGIGLVLLTAWHMLVTRAQLKPGEDVLVWGASSGVGSVATQLAKMMGARVIAVGGTDEKGATATALGADEAVNYNSQDGAGEGRRATARKGVEVVFEHTGEATWERSIQAMSWR